MGLLFGAALLAGGRGRWALHSFPQKSTQTVPVRTAERRVQTRHCHEVGIQADPEASPAQALPLPPPPPIDYAGLRAFLQRVEEPVIRELDKNWKSHAFDGFQVNWTDTNETVMAPPGPPAGGFGGGSPPSGDSPRLLQRVGEGSGRICSPGQGAKVFSSLEKRDIGHP